MRRKARRQLRFVVVFLMAGVVALTAGAVVALAQTGPVIACEPTTGSLQITKSVTGEPPAGWSYTQFCITVTGPNGYSTTENFPAGGVITLSNLAPGTYTISEATPSPAWAWNTTVEGGSTALVAVGVVAHKTVTNNGVTTTSATVAPGSLRITKTITGDNPGNVSFQDFYGHRHRSGRVFIDSAASPPAVRSTSPI